MPPRSHCSGSRLIAAAATGDRLAGCVAALSSGAWLEFFLVRPFGRFTITDLNDIDLTALLVLAGPRDLAGFSG